MELITKVKFNASEIETLEKLKRISEEINNGEIFDCGRLVCDTCIFRRTSDGFSKDCLFTQLTDKIEELRGYLGRED
jgi:hypothetical protein